MSLFVKNSSIRKLFMQEPIKKYQKYSPQPLVEYLYFVRLWRLLGESSQVDSSYSCFRPFMGQSWIITWLWYHVRFINSNNTNKNSPNNSKMAECYSIFTSLFALSSSNSTWRPQTINFLTRLLFELDIRAMVFASTTNLKSGPQFARICYWYYYYPKIQ